MTKEEMLTHVDHTVLKAFSTWEDVVKICDEAMEFNCASVCIPPCYIARVHSAYPTLNICTVVGFPLGYAATEAKIAETQKALAEGCNEIDMVINIADVKNGDYYLVEEEIRQLKKVCGGHILKVIIETCYLTEAEKIEMCKAVTNAGADFIKTSTGFGTGGATFEDIELFKKHIGPNVLIKAAGGVSTLDDLSKFLELGCERIGTSRAVGLVKSSGDVPAGY